MNQPSGRKKARPRKTPAAPPETPARTYKIGETARLVGVAPFVLRFWESQFPFLRTRHTPSKHRFYVEKDVETLKAVKRLLYKERFTIEGARKYIREHGLAAIIESGDAAERKAASSRQPARPDSETGLRRALKEVRRELISLREKLGK